MFIVCVVYPQRARTTVKVRRDFMRRDPSSLNFNLMALTGWQPAGAVGTKSAAADHEAIDHLMQLGLPHSREHITAVLASCGGNEDLAANMLFAS